MKEIHVTVNPIDVNVFKAIPTAQIWHMKGVKPHFMLTFKSEDAIDNFNKNHKFHLIRIKEEIDLNSSYQGYNFRYHEAHMNVYVPQLLMSEFSTVLKSFPELKVSQNILSHPTKFCVTQRIYNIRRDETGYFNDPFESLVLFKEQLKSQFIVEDIIRESCIRDSNMLLDHPWIEMPS